MLRSIARAGAAAGALLLLAPVALVECSRTPLGPPGAGDAPDARVADVSAPEAPAPDAVAPLPHGLAFTTFHFDTARTGWTDTESALVPSAVSRGLGRAWASAPLDDAAVAYTDATGMHVGSFPPRIFASPLYLDDVTLGVAPYAGTRESIVIAATTNDWVYAVAAFDAVAVDGAVVPAGTVLWRTQVGTPVYVPMFDQGTPIGVLSTPVVDVAASPPTLYVVAADANAGSQVFAIDVASGAILPGWPVPIDPVRVAALDRNVPPAAAPPAMASPVTSSQRSALLLMPDRRTLVVPFGSYYDGGIGWMVTVDVRARAITAAFSGSPVAPDGPPTNRASGGMWGVGGPALAGDGRIFMTTGNSPATSLGAPGVWGNSLLVWRQDLSLDATYSPFNYCLMDSGDTDLGGSSVVTFDAEPSRSATPHLAAFGGKQGVVYLVDRDGLNGTTVGRPPCDPVAAHDVPSTDGSLFGPEVRAGYSPPSPGPLPVFGPYSDNPGDNVQNHAKMRTTPALFDPPGGEAYVYVAGTSRDPGDLNTVVPPCVARLRVALTPGQKARFDANVLTNPTAVLQNPGSPIVTSHGSGLDPVVWVLDQNSTRTSPVVPKPGFTPPNAVLYAFDGATLAMLWRSAPDDLGPGGKYGHVVVAHGTVFVGTDRVAAFELSP